MKSQDMKCDIQAIIERFPPEEASRQVDRYLGKSTEEKPVQALAETNGNKMQITKIDFSMRREAAFDCLNCPGRFMAVETLYLFEIPASLRHFLGFRGDLVICPKCFAKSPEELKADLVNHVMEKTTGNINSAERAINALTKHILEQKDIQALAENLEATIAEDNEDSQIKLVVLKSYDDLPF